MFSNNFYNIEQESSDAVYLQIKYLKMKGKNKSVALSRENFTLYFLHLAFFKHCPKNNLNLRITNPAYRDLSMDAPVYSYKCLISGSYI